MHAELLKFAAHYGVPLSDRSCYRSFMWDGKTLATHRQTETWDDVGDKPTAISDPIPIDDFTMAHEIAHWVVADPVEREFPEWASAIGIVDGYANGGLSLDQFKTWEQFSMAFDGPLSKEEQNHRELCADFLAVSWCDRLGIPVKDEWRPINKVIDSLAKESAGGYSIENGWKALIWLREHGFEV